MQDKLVSRKREYEELQRCLESDRLEFVTENKAGMTREDILRATGIEGTFLSKILKISNAAILLRDYLNMATRPATVCSD